MCCITHNKLVIGVCFLSIALGLFTLTTSGHVIHFKDEFKSKTTHFEYLLVCSVLTLFTGTLQTVSSIFFITRRIQTQRWIFLNSLVFLVLLSGLCIAMSKFSLLPPGGGQSNSSVPEPLMLALNSSLLTNHSNMTSSEEVDLDSNEEVNTSVPKNKSVHNGTEEVSGPESASDQVPVPVAGSEESPESVPESDYEFVDTDGSEPTKQYSSVLLKLYFASILTNCLLLPIFLGLVASKATKFEARGMNLLDDQ